MKKILLLLCFFPFISFAQNVGIGTTVPVFKLDVKNGSINTDSIYRIRSFPVLSTAGFSNTFLGINAGRVNTGAYNSFLGYATGNGNIDGNDNTFSGAFAGYENTSGDANTYYGRSAGSSNTTGYSNTFIGRTAGSQNTWGYSNVAVGKGALITNMGGSGNTAIGADADVGLFTGLINATAVGYDSKVYASNSVSIGNYSVITIGGYTSWTTYSDGRFKLHVEENVSGLEFITKLRPVTYTLDVRGINKFLCIDKQKEQQYQEKVRNGSFNKAEYAMMKENEEKMIVQKENIVYTGFIAQEVEKAAKEVGYYFSGVHKPVNEKDNYSLAYSDFVVPLVKAVQEQQKQIEGLKKQVEQLQKLLGNK